MKKNTLLTITAAGLLFGSATALAQSSSPGASGYAPGQQDRTGATGPGASDFAPGQRAKEEEGKTAKDFAPGQQKKNDTTGAASDKSKDKDLNQKKQQ